MQAQAVSPLLRSKFCFIHRRQDIYGIEASPPRVELPDLEAGATHSESCSLSHRRTLRSVSSSGGTESTAGRDGHQNASLLSPSKCCFAPQLDRLGLRSGWRTEIPSLDISTRLDRGTRSSAARYDGTWPVRVYIPQLTECVVWSQSPNLLIMLALLANQASLILAEGWEPISPATRTTVPPVSPNFQQTIRCPPNSITLSPTLRGSQPCRVQIMGNIPNCSMKQRPIATQVDLSQVLTTNVGPGLKDIVSLHF